MRYMRRRALAACPAALLALCSLCCCSVGHARDQCAGPVVKLAITQAPAVSGSFGGQSSGAENTVWGVVAPFGKQLQLNETLTGSLAVAAPLDACTPPQGTALQGTVVLVERGGCSFTDKAWQLQRSGAATMLLFDNQPGCVSMGYVNETEVEGLKLPAISIPQDAGQALVSIVTSLAPSGPAPQVTVTPVEISSFDSSALLLWAMAVGTVVGGSLWCGHGYALAQRVAREGGGAPQASANAGEVVDITPHAAVAFIGMASAVLLLLFFFLSTALFYILLILFSLAALQALTIALAALLHAAVPALAKHMSTLPYLGPTPTLVLLALPPSAGVVLVWVLQRDASWSWVLQDILGIALMLLIFRTLRLSSVKVATILLSLAFVYDVFWVFIQPWLFNSQSVMVEVAEGGEAHETLPMLLRVPFMQLPRDLGGYSMLGFGDIILPGLLVAYMRRVDLDLHLSPLRSYFIPSCIAYAAGLTLTYIALMLSWFGDQGQPALLYLVPCTLGTVLLLGYLRNNLDALWSGTTHKRAKLRDTGPGAGPRGTGAGGVEGTRGGGVGPSVAEVDVERALWPGTGPGVAGAEEEEQVALLPPSHHQQENGASQCTG